MRRVADWREIGGPGPLAGRIPQLQWLLPAACLAVISVAATARAQGVADTAVRVATPGGEQPDEKLLEEIIVTGSRIRGVAAAGSKVVTISTEEIAETGRITTTDLLRSVPQVSNIGADESRVNGPQRANANIFASAAINLRGVGPEATLALLDGRRPGRSESGRSFDLNTIPSIVLQRIEVVADGASAIYGSDAVAGVVNLVPFHVYDGLTARANFGDTDSMQQNTVSLLGGKSWDRGNVVLAFEHHQRDHLLASARPSAYDDSFNTAGGIGSSTNSVPGNLTVAGALRPIVDTNSDGRLSLAEYNAAIGRPPNRLSNWQDVDALPEQKRDTLFAYFEFSATDRLKVYGQGHYSKRSFVRLSAAPTTTLTIPATNYYNQTGLALSVQYSFLKDLGVARSAGYDKPGQGTLGLKYDLGKGWQAETYFTDSKADTYRFNSNVINTTALSGSGVLSDATSAALSPIGGTNQAATLARFVGYSTNNLVFSMRDAALKADGPLFALPGGVVRMATGLELTKEVRESVNTNTSAGATVDTLVVAAYPTVSRTVKSAFAEFAVPIVGADNAVRGVNLLSLSIAGRSDSYFDRVPGTTQLDASTFNPKFGFTWRPVAGVQVRGSYGKSFRAPSLGDYSLGPPTTSASGLFSGMSHAASLPLPAGPVNAIAIQGGRTDGKLTPERAKTTSLGIDFTPPGVDGLEVSLTYYKLTYENQIVSAVGTNSLNNAAYATALAAAGLITFNPTTAQVQSYLDYGGFPFTAVIGPRNVYGTASGPSAGRTIPVAVLLDLRSVNTGIVDTNGFDFTLRYGWKNRWGSWRIANTSTNVSAFSQSLLTGTPQSEFVNTYGFPVRFGSRAQLGWERNKLSASLFVNYVNAYDNTQVSPTASVASNTIIDLNLGYRFGIREAAARPGKVSIQLNAQNLFDRKPPYALIGSPAQTYDSQNASAVGRLVSLNVEARL